MIWDHDISSLLPGSVFSMYGKQYTVLKVNGKNVKVRNTSTGAESEKTSPIRVYSDGNFQVVSVPEKKKEVSYSGKTLQLDDSFVALGSENDPYKDAPLSKVAARKKKR